MGGFHEVLVGISKITLRKAIGKNMSHNVTTPNLFDRNKAEVLSEACQTSLRKSVFQK